jgi:phosphoenolpyruvate carboxylase
MYRAARVSVDLKQESSSDDDSDYEADSGEDESSRMDADELANEIRDFARDAKIFQEFLKSLDTRKVCEEDSELLAETMEALQVIGNHLQEALQQALIIGDIDDDTLFPLKATFDRVWSMVQALLKVARKKDRRRHTIR